MVQRLLAASFAAPVLMIMSTTQAADAPEPQWLKDARAREAKSLEVRPIESKDKWFKARVPGKKITLARYATISGGIAVVVMGTLMLRGAPFLLALFAGLFFGIGAPHFFVGKMIKRRLNKFNSNFPDAIELMVRGLRSGLPIARRAGAAQRGTKNRRARSDRFSSCVGAADDTRPRWSCNGGLHDQGKLAHFVPRRGAAFAKKRLKSKVPPALVAIAQW